MNELIKIELKKISLKKQIVGLIIANVVIFVFLMLAFQGGTLELYLMTNHFIQSVFIIWQSVLISSLVVEEFKAKTIMQLYTYPFKRSIIMNAKLVLIFILMLTFSLVTQFVQHGSFMTVSIFIPQFSYAPSLQAILGIVLASPFAVMLAMGTLTVGLWMKSTIAPVIASLAVVTILSNISFVSLMVYLVSVGTIGIVGLILTLISVKDATTKDLIV